MGQIATVILFAYLLVIIPFMPLVENFLYLNGNSLSMAKNSSDSVNSNFSKANVQ